MVGCRSSSQDRDATHHSRLPTGGRNRTRGHADVSNTHSLPAAPHSRDLIAVPSVRHSDQLPGPHRGTGVTEPGRGHLGSAESRLCGQERGFRRI